MMLTDKDQMYIAFGTFFRSTPAKLPKACRWKYFRCTSESPRDSHRLNAEKSCGALNFRDQQFPEEAETQTDMNVSLKQKNKSKRRTDGQTRSKRDCARVP